MEQRLTKEVSRVRNQVMSFSNEGAAVNLNVPDTQEVKEVFNELVHTVVTAQKQITSLQKTMAVMAEDHLKSQETLIAWTQECVAGLSAQNAALSSKLEETQKQMQDMSYNIQGFVDTSVDSKIELPTFNSTPPGLFMTPTPKVIVDPKEVEDGDDSTLFPTATGVEIAPTFREVSANARQGGSVTLKVKEIKPVAAPKKSDEQKQQAKAMYEGVKKYSCPITAKGRWQWAIRKVLTSNRRNNLKVSMTRGKLLEHDTLAVRMKRAEAELFYQPIAMKEHVKGEADKINMRMDGEVKTINEQLTTQKAEYTTLATTLQTNIDSSNAHITDVDKRLVELQAKVDSGNQAMDEIEGKINKVIARASESEIALFNALKGRIQEASEKTQALKTSSGSVVDLMAKLNTNLEIMSEPVTYDTDAERFDSESKKLFAMLEFETALRISRGEIGLLDNNSFALGEILRQIRRDILANSVLAGGDYEDITPKSTVNELLAFVDSAHSTLDNIYETCSTANSLWNSHDSILGSKWNVLAGMAEAVKNVSGIADVIKSLTEGLAEKTDSEQVKEISSNIVTTALKPVNEKIDVNDKKGSDAIEETKTSVATVSADLKTKEDALKALFDSQVTEIKKSISQVAQQAAAAAGAAGAAAAAAGENSSSSPTTVIEGTINNVNTTTVMNLNLSDIEQDLEPMIKNLIEAYVTNNPSMSLSRGGARSGAGMGSLFELQAPSEVPPTSIEDGSHEFFDHELEMVFGTGSPRSLLAAENMNPDDITDEILDEGAQLQVGSLVKVILASHEYEGATGIVVGLIESAHEDETEAQGGTEEAKMDSADAEAESAAADPASNSRAPSRESLNSTKRKALKYRVAITPKTPASENINRVQSFVESSDDAFVDGFQSISLGSVGVNGEFASKPSSGKGSTRAMQEVTEQIHRLSRKIEDVISGRISTAGNNSNSNGLGGSTFGRGSPTNSISAPSVNDPMILELVTESMKTVALEIGDLRENSQRNLDDVKKQLKKAILTAINKAIIEQNEKDKPSMLTTRQMCVGCGRPALARALPFDKSLASNGFHPTLNASIVEGPDIVRGGFRMPVSKSQSLGKLAHPDSYNEESLFGEQSEITRDVRTPGTYSEILANIDHRDGITNVTDIGPGGMSISITSTTAPVRLSSTAKTIRHAQGKEEVAMLRPIYRKGMPGKSSERARASAGKSWAPERFGADLNLSPNAQAMKIPSIARAEMARQSMASRGMQAPGSLVGMEAELTQGLAQSSIESQFAP